MKAVVVLFDSLNRRALKTYNKNSFVKADNICDFASDGLIFDNHYIGSTPCMPARRDLLTGRLNFLERAWGPIEPYDITMPSILRDNGITTNMVTDHYHYWELGGDGYCQQFETFQMIRGQEVDPWVSDAKALELPDHKGLLKPQYAKNCRRFVDEASYSTPRTFQEAIDWVEENKGVDDFLLWVESFDPHEPFDCPQEFLDIYDDYYDGPLFNWPFYGRGVDCSEKELNHIQKCYSATISMADKWFGKFINKLKEYGMYEDTLIIVTADHGYLLGEHGLMAKNMTPQYNELANIPLFIHVPNNNQKGRRINALTQTIDIMPTILDYFNCSIPKTVTGHSMKTLIEGKSDTIRSYALFGRFADAVNITNGEYVYMRAAKNPDNQPIHEYGAVPIKLRRYVPMEFSASIEFGRFLKWTDFPVFKFPASNPEKNFSFVPDSHLFKSSDYEQEEDLIGSNVEKDMEKLLISAMRQEGSPDEQFVRLGLEG